MDQEARRAYARNRYHKLIQELKNTPGAYEAYKAEVARKAREKRERLKQTDPAAYEEYLQKSRKRQTNYRTRNSHKYHGTRREAVARWRKENPEAYRAQHLMRTYGITLEEYQAMLQRQQYRCAACATDKPGGKGDWHVDHCHGTGRVRGILCRACNTALGLVRDEPRTLRALANYLETAQ